MVLIMLIDTDECGRLSKAAYKRNNRVHRRHTLVDEGEAGAQARQTLANVRERRLAGSSVESGPFPIPSA